MTDELAALRGRVPADLSTAVYTVLQTLQYAGYAKQDDDA